MKISEPLTGEGLLSRKADFIKELQEYADSRYPTCHAVSWSHIVEIRLGISQKTIMDARIQEEIDRTLAELKPIVKKWLEYYIQNNDDGIYDAWLEQFWDSGCPDDRTIKESYIIRLYEKYLKNGIIEEYYYGHAPEEIRKGFLNKWFQRYSVPYDRDNELNLYIGQRGKVGKFYCGHDEFFEPLAEPEKSDCWKLIKQILIAEGD